MKKYALIISAIVLVVIAGLWIGSTRRAKAPDGATACTVEAKICPDGSAVGRTGPNCEFTPCPAEALPVTEVTSTTTTTTTTTTGGGNSILPYDSGVRGTVSLGPTCPVMRIPPDPQCADKPYATAIIVYRAGSQSPTMIGNSDAAGAFKFSLPPGSYTLTAGSGKMLPRCSPTTVTVTASGYTTADISCDSGIR